MMKTIIILLVALFAFAYCQIDFEKIAQKEFQSFTVKYSKGYKSNEEQTMRYRIFKENLKIIDKLNAESQGGNNFGVSPFADLTQSEFERLYLMPKRPTPLIREGRELQMNFSGISIPAKWDWRVDGLIGGVSCITPVKNQGQCGSCWAFSATEEIESCEFLQGHSKVGSPRVLSEQQIVDCATSCYGCNGGWTYLAYEYVESAGGQDSQSSYPYTAQDGSCRFNKANIQAKVENWKYVTTTKDEATMKSFAATTAPISICVDASSWQFYTGGVLKTCGSSIDHCVQLVGYGSYDNTEAWIVRNSWGTSWGLNGYILLEYGKNLCALADVATYVITSPW